MTITEEEARERYEFVSPTEDQLARLSQSAQLEYVPLTGSGLRGDFRQRAKVALERKIQEDFPSQRVGVKGTACSIGGEINDDGIHIKDILRVLKEGSEKDDFIVDITFFSANEGVDLMSLNWLYDSPQTLRRFLDGEGRGKVYPVVLIYDLLQLYTPIGTRHTQRLEAFMKKNPVNNGLWYNGLRLSSDWQPKVNPNAIRKIYVLDRPRGGRL